MEAAAEESLETEHRGPRLDASRSRDEREERSRGRGARSRSATSAHDEDHSSMQTEQQDTEGPAYIATEDGEDWIRLNYDSAR